MKIIFFILFTCFFATSCTKDIDPISGWTCYGYGLSQGEVESFLGSQDDAERFENTLNNRGGNWECRRN